ncbi:MAG TPA: glycosyltransferase family 2 protein [Chitinophagaceae bacterium]|nr:glycosyltransferase family 2 protein [Chitinophagaceae bacterium]
MHLVPVLFWISVFLIFYSYLGYGILVTFLVTVKSLVSRPPKASGDRTPGVTLVVAAYNEEDSMPAKIRNCLELDYPPDQLRVLFITDGSTDGTPGLVRAEPGLILLHQAARLGKTAALNRAMQQVETDLVVFSDANTLLNPQAIRNIVRHYQDPRIGGVAGEKKVIGPQNQTGAGSGEGLYWKYESWLKRMDSALWTVVGAAGELFSIRTSLFEPLPPGIILDDFVISLRVAARGYRVAYEPHAFAMETPSSSIREEQKRKVRISAGGFQAMILLKGLLLVYRHPVLSFQYISHRVLRWTLTPLALPLALLCNLLLAARNPGPVYVWLLALQLGFYGVSLTGLYLAGKNIRNRFLFVPYYFLFMNYSVYLGFFRFLRGRQTVIWEKAARENPLPVPPDPNP